MKNIRTLHKLRLYDSTNKKDVQVTLYWNLESWSPHFPKSMYDAWRETQHQSEHAMLQK